MHIHVIRETDFSIMTHGRQAFKESAFRLESSKWKKGDELVDGEERRTFTFLAESRDAREHWLYRIRYVHSVLLPRFARNKWLSTIR